MSIETSEELVTGLVQQTKMRYRKCTKIGKAWDPKRPLLALGCPTLLIARRSHISGPRRLQVRLIGKSGERNRLSTPQYLLPSTWKKRILNLLHTVHIILCPEQTRIQRISDHVSHTRAKTFHLSYVWAMSASKANRQYHPIKSDSAQVKKGFKLVYPPRVVLGPSIHISHRSELDGKVTSL
jgi:hypothetical protein